ncbi:MAG: SPASM domain-containing protein [Melioribacteraceae bacterium]|nr:SPASM domain-containing protein [Melioribacteraceae bacterium]
MLASQYNIYVKLPDSDKYVLIHGYTGAIDLVNYSIAERLKKNEINSISDDHRNYLFSRGYITNKSESEEYARVAALAKVIAKYENKKRHYAFLVSYNCNLRCPYCYEANISNFGSEWTKETFTKEYIDAAYSFIKKNSSPNEKHAIVLYGGEPFLKENSDAVRYIINTGIKYGYRFSAITNGYDLDEYTDLLGSDSVNMIQITLDGDERVHNKRRPHYTGNGTFTKIINNISLALEAGTHVNLRINVDKENLFRIESLADIFTANGWTDKKNFSCYLSPVQSRNESHLVNEGQKDMCLSGKYLVEMLDIYKYMKEMKRINGKFSIFRIPRSEIKNSLVSAIKNKRSTKFKGNFCGATGASLILDPKGDIYSCYEFVGDEEEKIGSFYPKAELEHIDSHKLIERKIYNLPKCNKCKYALFCGGGCAAFSKNKYGTVMKGYCDQFPAIFQRYAIEAFNEAMEINQ